MWGLTCVLAFVLSLLRVCDDVVFVVRCDGINKILAALLAKELNGDSRCFDVTANLLGGFWYVEMAV